MSAYDPKRTLTGEFSRTKLTLWVSMAIAGRSGELCSSDNKRLDEALARYRGPKGNLRFPLDEPIPYDLVERIVRLRAKQDQAKATAQKRSKRSRT